MGCERGSGPKQRKERIEEFSTSPFGDVLLMHGPMGHGAHVGKFYESGFGPIIFVTNLGNFRRLEIYINSVRIFNKTYVNKI